MTKLLALLCLVLSVLLTVGRCTETEGEIIVKDGHRVVVVEYDADGKTNTRVLMSPPERGQEQIGDQREMFRNVKRKVIETPSSLPVSDQVEEERELHASAGEIICDAIGKCKNKVASVLGRVDDPTAHDTKETVARAARDVKETLAHEPHFADHKAQETRPTMSKSQNVLVKAKLAVKRLGTAVTAAMNLTKVGSVVSLIGIAAAFGMCVWVTVVSKYLLASVLGRHRFSVAQSKVYSVYFKAISVGLLVGLLGHVISRRRKVLTDAVEMWQAAMFERIKVEKEEGRGLDKSESHSSEAAARTCGKKVRYNMDEDAVNRRLKKLNERLSRLNAYSSRLNLLTLMSLTWHFVYLGHRLSLTYSGIEPPIR
ncbi:hypothetical protein YC2023_083795 [Brassica napus]